MKNTDIFMDLFTDIFLMFGRRLQVTPIVPCFYYTTFIPLEVRILHMICKYFNQIGYLFCFNFHIHRPPLFFLFSKETCQGQDTTVVIYGTASECICERL